MRIQLITAAERGSRRGNRITALRWARIFRQSGHRVRIDLPDATVAEPQADVLVALHAAHSHAAIVRNSTNASLVVR